MCGAGIIFIAWDGQSAEVGCLISYRLQNSRFRTFSEGGKRRKRDPRLWSAQARKPHTPTGRVRRESFSLAVFSLVPNLSFESRSRSQKIRLFCILNILESKNQFQQLAVLIYFPEMPSKPGQFSGTPVDISSARVITMGSQFTCNSRLGNFARTSISFVCYDRGILEYFARQ